MNDTELNALAILVMCEGDMRHWANVEREMHGEALAYNDKAPWPALDKVEAELKCRGIL